MVAITLDAKPQPIVLDTGKAALIVVDMQNDFGSNGGLFEHGGVDVTSIQKVVPATARAIAAARKAAMKVIYLKMGYRPDLSDLGSDGAPNRVRHLHFGVGQPMKTPDGKEGRFLVRDTWGTEIIPELKPVPGDIEIWKSRFSGFYETELDATLKKLGAKQLVFTGCTTSICVESTVRDAMFRDYQCVLLRDCMAEPIGNNLPRSNHEASLLSIEVLFGWTASCDEFVKGLAASKLQ
ncbi:MAG: cysteine hydrolase family protein [Acidobacteriota bacterium]